MEVILCNIPQSAKYHDCWILHKPTKRIFYAPYGHHYQIIDYLMNNGYSDILQDEWTGKKDSDNLRTGDVKHGMPRTAKENPVTAKKLREALVKTYHEVRGLTPPQEVNPPW